MEWYSTIRILSHCSLVHHCHLNLGFRASWWNVAVMSTKLGEHWTSFDVLVLKQLWHFCSKHCWEPKCWSWFSVHQSYDEFLLNPNSTEVPSSLESFKARQECGKNWVVQNPMEKWRNKVLLEYVHYTKFYISYARHITLQPSRSTHPIWTSTHPISKQWVW